VKGCKVKDAAAEKQQDLGSLRKMKLMIGRSYDGATFA
jgi:hypothetical protein